MVRNIQNLAPFYVAHWTEIFFSLYPLHKILVHQIQGPSNLVIFYYFQRYPKFSPSLSKSSSTFKSGKWYIKEAI